MDVINNEDNDFLNQWKNGSEAAFEGFYEKYLKLLLNQVLKKTGDFEISREIVQETFIIFYSKKEKIENNPLLYLQTILKYKLLEYYRRLKNQKEISSHKIPENLDNNLWEKILMHDANTVIMKSISLLPVQQRKIFMLSRIENMSNKDIAEQLNLSVKTIEASITRSIKALRKNNESLFFNMIIGLLWI